MKITKSSAVFYVLSIVIAAGIFIIDLLTPLGYAEWLGYLPLLIIISWKLNRLFVYTLASACTAFTVLGFIYSPPGGIKPEMALFNRTLAISTIWVAVILIIKYKQGKEKIQELASLLDKAQDAITPWDLGYRLIYWNKGAERLYGWTAEEAIGKNPVEFLFKDKEEPPQFIESKRIVLEKGEWTGELHQITKDGRDVIVESHWTLVLDDEEKPKSI